MKQINFSTDTNIAPTEDMIHAIQEIELKDAVYGLDKSTNELEEYAAALFGMDAAIFLPSGVMGNLIALLTHTNRGNEIVLEENAHIRTSETGGLACVAQLMCNTIKNETGCPTSTEIEQAIRSDNIHYPETGLICLENTHYRYGGLVIPEKRLISIREVSLQHDIPIHLDGARIFNAAVSLNVDVKDLVRHVDSIMFCLSKSLGAPVGSMLCGSNEFIEKARKHKKMVGGGWRKVGWLSKAALIALKNPKLAKQLKKDHDNAQFFAEQLQDLPGIEVKPEQVQSNLILAYCTGHVDVSSLLEALNKRNIKIASLGKNGLRLYISSDTPRTDIVTTIEVMEEIIQQEL